jgi:hypothetical protein
VNESVEEYLVRMLGPKHLPLAVVLPITIIYVTIFVSGVVGNVAVCVVIARNKSMRTATNYYLFSLAVSDLTLLLLGKCTEHLNTTTTPYTVGSRVCHCLLLRQTIRFCSQHTSRIYMSVGSSNIFTEDFSQ